MPRRPRPAIEQLIALLVLSVAGGTASADEMHDHGKHVHGEVTVNIALDGRTLALEIDAPAAQTLGFEKSPRDDRERAVTDKSGGAAPNHSFASERFMEVRM